MSSFREDTKRFEAISDSIIKCKCGHSVAFLNKKGTVICSWCGRRVFKNKKEEFEFKLRKEMRKNEISNKQKQRW